MVAALGDHPALGAWEIMNEPEGSVYNNQASLNPCFDTTLGSIHLKSIKVVRGHLSDFF